MRGIERDNEVRELTKRVERLLEIEYAPGFENYAAVAPMFEQVLKVMGYRYIYGHNGPDSIDFFLKSGRYAAADLNSASEEARNLTPNGLKGDGISLTVKFLDSDLERLCVNGRN